MTPALTAYLRDLTTRCEQATKGPWEKVFPEVLADDEDTRLGGRTIVCSVHGSASNEYAQADADFITMARTDLPTLARLVRDAHTALEEQRRQMSFPGIPPVFSATMIRMIDEALARAEALVKEGG